MPPPRSVPDDVLQGLLNAAADALAAIGSSVPEMLGVTHTSPIVRPQCEMLVAYHDGITAKPFGESRPNSPGDLQVTGIVHMIHARLELWRCVPGASDDSPVPDWDEAVEAARLLLRDAWSIQVEVAKRIKLGTLIGNWISPEGGMDVFRGDFGLGKLTALPISTLAGYKLTMEVGIPAIVESIS